MGTFIPGISLDEQIEAGGRVGCWKLAPCPHLAWSLHSLRPHLFLRTHSLNCLTLLCNPGKLTFIGSMPAALQLLVGWSKQVSEDGREWADVYPPGSLPADPVSHLPQPQLLPPLALGPSLPDFFRSRGGNGTFHYEIQLVGVTLHHPC